MDFGLSEEQELLVETVRGFVANECPPTRLREIFDGDAPYDEGIWGGMLEMGLGGLAIPEAYGGAGLEMIDLALVAEVLGEGAMPGPFLGHSLAGLAVALGGSEAQKQRWLPELASGERLGTIALGEEGEANSPAAFRTRAEGGKVSGTKPLVPNASQADLIAVGLADGGLAVVERAAGGVVLEPLEGIDRTRRLERLRLEGAPCEVLETAAADRVRDAGLVLLAADAFGGASRLIEMSIEYSKTRVQFGQPIGQFQAVKHLLAEMALDIEPARGLYWFAAHAFDHLPDQAQRAAALTKSHLTDRFMSVARDAVDIHGGLGFTWECDVQIWFKRAIFDQTFLGNPGYHRERAAELAGW